MIFFNFSKLFFASDLVELIIQQPLAIKLKILFRHRVNLFKGFTNNSKILMIYFTYFIKRGIEMNLKERRKDYLIHLLYLFGVIPSKIFKNYFVSRPEFN